MCLGKIELPHAFAYSIVYTSGAEQFMDVIQSHYGTHEVSELTQYIWEILRSNAFHAFISHYHIFLHNQKIIIDDTNIILIHRDFVMVRGYTYATIPYIN